MSGIQKIGGVVPVSREMLLSHGLVEPTPEEKAKREEADRLWDARRAEALPLVAAYLAAIDAITDPPSRAVLDLHHRNAADECDGCDFGGYEGEPPPWPCRTVEVIAEHHGITTPDLIAFGLQP